jgi:TonB family protein
MQAAGPLDVYVPLEIAEAAGVPVEQVIAALGSAEVFVSHPDAVRLGRTLRTRAASRTVPEGPLFSLFVSNSSRGSWSRATDQRSLRPLLPMALSSTIHACLIAAFMFLAALGRAPSATSLASEGTPEDLQLVFLSTPGPGGGGGGGGLYQPTTPSKALRVGHDSISSPLPVRRPPPAIAPVPPPQSPPQPIAAEPLPVLVSPIASAPADDRDRIGVLQQARTTIDSRGSGRDGGAGTGAGSGLGQGDGPGVGPGSGGGTGGGPFRPGSGLEPPRLRHEVKPDYPDEARRKGLSGEVLLEIVVRRDGSVGDVKLLHGLGSLLDERAMEVVRQWRFDPARRQGAPIDVIVEVSVEFRMR